MSRLIMRGVLGSVGKPKMAFGDYGYVLRNDGENWSIHNEFPSKYVYAIDTYKDKILAAGYTGRIKLFDGSVWTEQQPAGDVNGNWLVTLIGSTFMVAANYNGRIYLHDGTTWSEVQPAGNANRPWYAGAHYKGKFVVSYYPGRMYLFDGSSWAEIPLYGGGDRWVRSIAVNEYGIFYSIYNDYCYWYDFATQTTTQHKPQAAGSSYAAVGINGNRLYAGAESSGKAWEYDGSSWNDMALYSGVSLSFYRSIGFHNNRGIIHRTDIGSSFIYYWNGSSFEEFPIDQLRRLLSGSIYY